MGFFLLKVLVLPFLLFVLSGECAIVTKFSDCTYNCEITSILYPSITTILALTSGGEVYYSKNEGLNWLKTSSNVAAIYNWETEQESILLLQQSGGVCVSTDGGQTTPSCSVVAYPMTNVQLHPNKAGWFLFSSCNASEFCTVRYSFDYATTFFQGDVVSYPTWSTDPNTADSIFAIHQEGSDYIFGYYPNITQGGVNFVGILNRSPTFQITSHYLYASVVGQSGVHLFSSSNTIDPSHRTFINYHFDLFPTDVDLNIKYSFLDDSSHSEFIAVTNGAQETHVYSSDFDGDQFALSLPLVSGSVGVAFDFAKFAGLGGVYISNSYPNSSTTLRKTKITYDNGGEWELLPAPAKDYNNNPIQCSISKGCSLHLHGMHSWETGVYSPTYSSENAIGLMLAIGNVGEGLSDDGQATYFTRDAGLSWTQLFPEPTVYEFGDHGGILVFATTNAPTSRVYYSLDEGKTVSNFQFAQSPLNVENIMTEPSGTGRSFFLVTTDPTTNVQAIYSFDFSDLNMRICGDADYEQWSPAYGNAESCFMGSTTTYLRRRQDSQCYNNRNTDHVLSQTPCSCSWEDYECDVGFISSARNVSRGFNCTSPIKTDPCLTGYRLVPASACKKGLDLNSNCYPPSSSSSSSSDSPSATSSSSSTPFPSHRKSGKESGKVTLAVVFSFIFVGSACTIVIVLYKKHTGFRDFVQEKILRQEDRHLYGRLVTNDFGISHKSSKEDYDEEGL